MPAGLADLLALPGVGEYTARAVQAFAFGRRAAVVDINVRRVLARAVGGQGQPAAPSTTRDLAAMEAVLPPADAAAAVFCAAMMELGAVLCTAGVADLPGLPDPAPVCLAAGRLPALPGTGSPTPALRRHRPAGPRTAAGRAARLRRSGARRGAGRGLARGRPAPASPGCPRRRRAGRSAAGRPVRAAVLNRRGEPARRTGEARVFARVSRHARVAGFTWTRCGQQPALPEQQQGPGPPDRGLARYCLPWTSLTRGRPPRWAGRPEPPVRPWTRRGR